MHTIRQYLRCGERILWKKPGFTLTVVLMLALAIGVSTRILGQAGSTTTGDSDKAGRSLALTNVTVIDGNGGKPKPRMTLLISGERIADLFPTGKKQLPPDASVMDLPGYFVTPGFIDSHYHLMIGTRKKEEEEGRRRFALLGGVTSVRDMAGDAIALSQLAQVSASGRALSPRVYFSALMAGPTWFTDRRVKSISRELPVGEAPWARAITPATDLKQAVAEAKNLGVMGIKIYANLTAELAAKITSEAHRQGLKVWGHSTVFPARPSDLVAAGVEVLSHSDPLVFETVKTVPEKSSAGYRGIDWKNIPVDSPAIVTLLKRMRNQGTVLDPTLYTTVDNPNRDANNPQWAWVYGVTKLAHQLGVTIVAGTDAPERPRRRDFPNIHLEMELLVNEVGMTPLEAITAATRNGAQVLGIQNSYGTIAKGKVADLVILRADPIKDIKNTSAISQVIKGGVPHQWEKTVMPSE